MVYRIEVSPNNRAGCKNTECKNAGIKIFKGQMRFGSWVEGPEFQSWSWKHWGCVTPKQIANLKKGINNDATELDGFEDLPEDFQEKIRNAVQEGHVADEDWGGDAEMNRTGMNGYRTPASKKAKKEIKEADSPSPSKPPAKKRGHVKVDQDDGGAEQDGPASKKSKAAIKKEEKVKQEENNGESANEAQPARKGRKKSTKAKAEVDSEAGDESAMLEPPVKKSRAPRRAAAVMKIKDEGTGSEAFSDAPETASPPPVKKMRAPRKPAAPKKVKEEEVDVTALDDAIDSAAAPPAKRTRAPRKPAAAKKVKEEEVDVTALDDAIDSAAAPPAKRTRAPRKTAVARRINAGIGDNDPHSDAPTSPAPDENATNLQKGAAAKVKSKGSSATTTGDVPTQAASEFQITTSKPNEEDIETKDDAENDAEATEVAPKPKKGGKKAVKKASNGTGATASTKAKGNTSQTEASDDTEKPKRANGRVTHSHKS